MKRLKTLFLVITIVLVIPTLTFADDISFSLSQDFATKYVSKSGGGFGKGSVSQTYASIEIKGFYAYTWVNYDFGLKEKNEQDYGFGKCFSLGKALNGSFNSCVGYDKWTFPQFDNDDALGASLSYSGPVNAEITLTKVITNGFTLDQNRLHLNMSKLFPLGKAGLAITPSVSTAYLNNFYGEHGWAHITAGLKASFQITNRLSASAYGKCQTGLIEAKEDLCYGGGDISINF